MIGLRSSGLFGVSVIACDPDFREAPWVSILSFLMLYGRKILLQGPVSWYVGQISWVCNGILDKDLHSCFTATWQKNGQKHRCYALIIHTHIQATQKLGHLK